MSTAFKIRAATNADVPGITKVISTIWQEFGELVVIEDEERDLLDIETHYFGKGGAFVVLVNDEGVIKGTHAALPKDEPGVCEFKRLYLAKELRGENYGHELMDWAIDWARVKKFKRIEFWSDTKYDRAHQFFKRFGFERDGQIRHVEDVTTPYSEYFYFLNLQNA